MSSVVTFKCPSCGAYLEFEPGTQQFSCPYCLQSFTEQELHKLLKERGASSEPDAAQPQVEAGSHLRSYHCQTCGAEIVTSDTTAASRCYYCHSPVVLSDRLTGEFSPDGVLPFKISREEALKRFESFLGKKKFVDRRFFSRDQIEDFSGVYYPFWLGDVTAQANFDGEGTRVSVLSGPREVVTTTRYFRVQRSGQVQFRDMVRKALTTCDRQLSDGIHPYNTEEIKPFDMSYLSGFLAEKRDIAQEGVEKELTEEAKGYIPEMMKEGGKFDTLSGRTDITDMKTKMRYVLLPAWVLTYRSEKPGKVYYYLMNGQTGAVCGKLPIDWKKLGLTAGLIGAAIAGVLCAGGAMLW